MLVCLSNSWYELVTINVIFVEFKVLQYIYMNLIYLFIYNELRSLIQNIIGYSYE